MKEVDARQTLRLCVNEMIEAKCLAQITEAKQTCKEGLVFVAA